MKKTKQNLNRDYSKDLVSEFGRGLADVLNIAVSDQPSPKESEDLCLPPLLVQAFQSGLEEELRNCNCGCGEEHDCAHDNSSSAHSGCGGCKHHG